MNQIFKFNTNAKYLTKISRDWYNGNNFSLLDDKGPSVKIKLLNIFIDHHMVTKLSVTAMEYDKW